MPDTQHWKKTKLLWKWCEFHSSWRCLWQWPEIQVQTYSPQKNNFLKSTTTTKNNHQTIGQFTISTGHPTGTISTDRLWESTAIQGCVCGGGGGGGCMHACMCRRPHACIYNSSKRIIMSLVVTCPVVNCPVAVSCLAGYSEGCPAG